MVYIIKRSLLCDLKNVQETINNSQFYILNLFFSSYDNRFSNAVPCILRFSAQGCCILCKYRKNRSRPDWCLFLPDLVQSEVLEKKNVFKDGVFIIDLYTHKVSNLSKTMSLLHVIELKTIQKWVVFSIILENRANLPSL